jgi:hypothetical protein
MDDGGTSWHKLAPVVWKLKRQAADLKRDLHRFNN